MTKDEAIELITDQLATVQLRSQGFSDWKGEIDLGEMAEEIFGIAQQAESH